MTSRRTSLLVAPLTSLAAVLGLAMVGPAMPAGAATGPGVSAVVGAPAATPTLRNRSSRNSVGAPRQGVLWGAYLSPQQQSRGPWKQRYRRLERRIDRRLDIVKAFYGWNPDHLFPNRHQRGLARQGRVWQVSWNAANYHSGRRVRFRDIIDGRYDASLIRPQAVLLRDWGRRVIVDFDHEMEGDRPQGGIGTAKQYRRAYRHIVSVFREVGATNVSWAWVPMGWRSELYSKFYPGRRWVDWIGWDPYNFATCRGSRWRWPAELLESFYEWTGSRARTRGKPLMLGEYAVTVGPRADEWYSRMPAALRSMPRIKAVIQFSSRGQTGCDFRVASNADTLAAFRTAGRSPYVRGRQ